jgi:hypothetical protein
VPLGEGKGETAMFEHDDAVNVRIDIEANPDGVLRHIMVIETRLVTSRLVEGYDDSLITDLVQAGVQFVNDHYSEINTIRIIHVSRDIERRAEEGPPGLAGGEPEDKLRPDGD